MSLDPETSNQQLALLAEYRRTLTHLLEQATAYGGVVLAPPQTAAGIAEARAEIGRIKATLREGGVQVEDEPNDKAPPQAEPARPPRAGGDVVMGDKVGGDKVMGDKRTVDTGGGDYAEGNIDKRQGVFAEGGTIYGPVVGVNQGSISATYTIQQRPDPALHQLRAPVGDFVGRTKEIDEIVSTLTTTNGRAATITGVRGMGGIGKTELAYAAAQQLKDAFPDAQLLVELRGASANPLTPEAALQVVIRAFEREAKLPDDLSQLQSMYCDKLTDKRVLIVADDAKDAAQVRPLLPPPGCALLITSRNRFGLPGMAALDLGTLPPEEAEKLLLKICLRIGGHAAELARLCDYLPLALRVSAGVLANSPRNVARYLEQLQAERLRHLNDPDNPNDPQASVEASLRLSYAALEPVARQTLCQLSVFPTSFDQSAALAVAAIEGDTEGPLDVLQRRSLLEWDAQTERYNLHDLMRAFAAALLDDTDLVRLRHARYYMRVAARAGELYLQGGEALLAGLALFDRERIHIDAGWGWAEERAGEQEADRLLLDYADATAYVGVLRYDNLRNLIPQLEATLAVARRLGKRGVEGATLGNLGNAYRNLGNARKAIEFYEQQLVIARELDDRSGQANALGNLGVAYIDLGEARKAIDFYQQALVIARALGERRQEGEVLGKLGNAFRNLGYVREAIEFYEQALVIARALGDLRREGVTVGNIGIAYRQLGEARKAIGFYEQQLVIARELGNRHGEGTALGNLGVAYIELGEARKAIDFCEQWLAMASELGNRRGEGFALGNLGSAYADLGETHKAIDFYEQWIVIADELIDERGKGIALGKLGIAYAVLGDVRKAIEIYKQALAIAQSIGDWRGKSITSWNLGLLLEQQGDLVRAAELMQVQVDYYRKISHPDAEKKAAYLEELRQRLAALQGEPHAAAQSPLPAEKPNEG